ncbi:MAG: glycosyl transferase [SAR86 cluster bacterium]|uniref:Glycosyl transferase n=1 Tax=SAR86 cluster bacterium TaxID=2030880 RepID=A0A2A4MUS3_9GAMM|nr:MAG: glycosyl transferase [SAR86 cluster bacterium]
MSYLLYLGVIFFASVLLSAAIKSVALRIELLAIPVARSAHNKPTPVGGGLAISLLSLMGLSYCYGLGLIEQAQFFAMFTLLAIAVVGIADDIWQLAIKWRLGVQLLASVVALTLLGGMTDIDFTLFTLVNPWLLNLLGLLALIWLVNLYNFMDGIDGLAGLEACFVSALACYFGWIAGDGVLILMSLTLFAACLGFLVWNWSPAQLFMGDVGSGFIGLYLGIMAIVSMQNSSMTVWTWLLLLGIFHMDASITLLRRFANGEKWYQGHSSHAYQHAARSLASHRKVCIIVLIINCLWLTPLAWLTVEESRYGVFWTLLGLLPLVFIALKLNAGKVQNIASSDSNALNS